MDARSFLTVDVNDQEEHRGNKQSKICAAKKKGQKGKQIACKSQHKNHIIITNHRW